MTDFKPKSSFVNYSEIPGIKSGDSVRIGFDGKPGVVTGIWVNGVPVDEETLAKVVRYRGD